MSLSVAVTGAPASAAGAPPDGVAQAVVARVQAASKADSSPGENDALLWFAPDGRHVAVCDRTTRGAHTQIYDIASGTVIATLDAVCANVPARAGQWSADGALFYIVPGNGPVAIYSTPQG